MYKHLFFDLDHTLWDYNRNAVQTLEELYITHGFDKYNLFTKDEFVREFNKVNDALWDAFNKNTIDKAQIRNERFSLILESLGLERTLVPSAIDTEYVLSCPLKTHLVPKALESLDYLNSKYNLHIITNGFEDVQFLKLDNSGLRKYFNKVVTSESSGYNKPAPEIFQYALKCAGAYPHESIMIGDNMFTDIIGAKGANIDQVFFNPNDQRHEVSATYEVNCLSELTGIF